MQRCGGRKTPRIGQSACFSSFRNQFNWVSCLLRMSEKRCSLLTLAAMGPLWPYVKLAAFHFIYWGLVKYYEECPPSYKWADGTFLLFVRPLRLFSLPFSLQLFHSNFLCDNQLQSDRFSDQHHSWLQTCYVSTRHRWNLWNNCSEMASLAFAASSASSVHRTQATAHRTQAERHQRCCIHRCELTFSKYNGKTVERNPLQP